MYRYRMVMRAEPRRTKVLLQSNEDQILKAVLPLPADHQAPPLLLTALSRWAKEPIHVVLSVAERGALCGFGLHDDFGFDITSEHYLARIHIRGERYHRERLTGFGDFAPLVRLLGGAR
jgi:hypothetical protein